MCIFVPNISLGQLLNISPVNHTYLKTFHLELLYIKVWFTNQIPVQLNGEDKISLTLVINDRLI